MLSILESQIGEKIGTTNEIRFFKDFIEGDEKALKAAEQEANKLTPRTFGTSRKLLQDFLETYPWGLWEHFYHYSSISERTLGLAQEVFANIHPNMQAFLMGTRDSSQLITHDYENLVQNNDSNYVPSWWAAEAMQPFQVTLPGWYEEESKSWLPFLMDEYEISPGKWRAVAGSPAETDNINIYTINSYSDWVNLCRQYPAFRRTSYPLDSFEPKLWVTANLDEVRNRYNAIRLSVPGYLDAAYRYEAYLYNAPCLLMGWHPGATLWL